ncbi:MAG: sensor histidine kinase [Thermocrispum sp.]
MRRIGWGAVAYVFVAIAICLPVVAAAGAIGVAMLYPGQSMLNQGLLVVLGFAFLLAVTWVALLPPVRSVEMATARALLGLELPDVRRPQAWDSRRRGGAWLATNAGIGLLVAVGLLYLLPLGVGLVVHPFTGAEELQWPGGTGDLHTGTGWSAAWVAVPGLVSLALVVALVYGAGALLTRLAPRMIGPSLVEQVAVAAERERDLARANALAREVHDSLGHRLTAMTVQATAARRLLAIDPEAAERAMAAVEDLGRRAQADVDAVVGALRGHATSTPAERADLMALLRPLLDQAPMEVAVEAPTALHLAGGPANTAYRVVQEALTNATRHGSGGADLRVVDHGDEVVLEVRNPVAAPPTGTPDGRAGLRGLRERVLLDGGTVHTGPEGDDTWLLRVTLPTG